MSDSHRDDLYKIIYATAYQTPATNRSSINPLTTLLYEVIPLKEIESEFSVFVLLCFMFVYNYAPAWLAYN